MKPDQSLLSDQKGVALVITLTILGMLLVVLVAFTTTVRLERMIARSAGDETRSQMIAQAGVDHAIYLLTMATTNYNYVTAHSNATWVRDSVAPNRTNNWAAPSNQQPILMIFTNAGNTNSFRAAVWLASQMAPGAKLTNSATAFNPGIPNQIPTNQAAINSLSNSPNFNANCLIAFTNHVTRSFRLRWVYLDDGGRPAVTNGRYAFWCDDESMKINLLTSGTNTALYGASETEVSMSAVPGINTARAGDILAGRSGGFETLETIRELTSPIMDMDDYNRTRFYTTIYSRTADTNAYAARRVNLNALASLTIPQITNALGSACQAVAAKYPATDQLQFAANLKEWMRPTRTPTNEDIMVNVGYGAIPLIGRNSTPLIDEVTFQTFVARTAVGAENQFACSNVIQVKLLNLYSRPYVHPSLAKLEISAIPDVVITNIIGPPGVNTYGANIWTVPWPTTIDLSDVTHPAYTGLTYVATFVSTNVSIPTNRYAGLVVRIPRTAAGFAAVTLTNGWPGGWPDAGLVDVAHVRHASNILPGTLAAPVVPGIIGSASIAVHTNQALKCPGDPRVIKATNVWVYSRPQATNQFNFVAGNFVSNSAYRPDLLSLRPGYWGDSNSPTRLQLDGGFFFRNGPMQSIGEIGRIPIQSTGTNNMWRTIKLYGDGNATNPTNADYMLLDYIMVDHAPRARVNLNAAREYPAGDQGVLASLLERASIPINAIGTNTSDFMTLSSMAGTLPRRIATNIVAVAQGNVTNRFPTAWRSTGPYRSIGHFILVNSNLLSSVTNRLTGLGTWPDIQATDARREGPLTSIANALTVQGEQFSIYSLGQSIQFGIGRVQTNAVPPRYAMLVVATNILSESFIQTVVERTPTGLPPPDHIYYRTLYYRILTE